jgi:hypothetical protein
VLTDEGRAFFTTAVAGMAANTTIFLTAAAREVKGAMGQLRVDRAGPAFERHGKFCEHAQT